ncbi:MAG: hypothetical protein DI628_01645 [Blastochloris viridis]|uniref:Secreted protein n=1 Tax=Blastochloris viridis TaxID=1079 RepID=A0A6N4R2M5_BLAVI|nr:MAG: hypothetical protein DI628_01645 [Blastochloris viridis]
MKPLTAVVACATLAIGLVGNAIAADCAANAASNAQVIAKAKAAATSKEREAILLSAINANPANAVCLLKLSIDMSDDIEPAAGEEGNFNAADLGNTTTTNEAPPAENASQINERRDTGSASPVTPAI